MKVVILAGGLGTRISEESRFKPKPLIEIGGMPILWHIMKSYSYHGFHEFIICLGYKGNMIKSFFADYHFHASDLVFDFENGSSVLTNRRGTEPWKVTVVDTGETTMTGGRLKRIEPYVGGETFMLTYGDGLSDIDIAGLAKYHQAHDKLVTVSAVQPSGRFGALELDENAQVRRFQEKPQGDGRWINGGYFVMDPGVFRYLADDSTVLEEKPLQRLAEDGQLMARKHLGFWHPMDTMKDRADLEEMWSTGRAAWKRWEG